MKTPLPSELKSTPDAEPRVEVSSKGHETLIRLFDLVLDVSNSSGALNGGGSADAVDNLWVSSVLIRPCVPTKQNLQNSQVPQHACGHPAVATHMLANPKAHRTLIGSLLCKSGLHELPQLWSILVDDMSFVGPRSALFNQHDLIELRTQKNVHTLVLGVPSRGQVNGRDELPISQNVGNGLRIAE